jgi:UDP-N-acetylmuramate dehydrogenase
VNLPSLPLIENVPLAPSTTLGVGGNARYFLRIESANTLPVALDWAAQSNLPTFVLGGGSNLVVADSGFPGLVLQFAPEPQITVSQSGEVSVNAGADWDMFVRFCVEWGLQGIECLAGIPGSVGATPVQNVGAYGQEIAETLAHVTAFDRTTGTMQTLSREDCRFAYRRSRFNHDEPGRWIIVNVTFALTPNGAPTLRYADLKNHFAAATTTPTLTEVYAAVREIRSRKGMVVRPDDPDSRSAGSFFKNPTVAADEFARIAAIADGDIPHWPQPDSTVKLSAAWLIERSRLRRGAAMGNAGLSSKHILALVNRGGAAASEIAALACYVQARVFDFWGVTLSPEPVFLGFASPETLPENAIRWETSAAQRFD